MTGLTDSAATSALLSELKTQLSVNAKPDYALRQQSYMKSDMPYWGVNSPLRKTIEAKVFKKFPPANNAMYRCFISALFNSAEHREEWYCAVDYAVKYKKFISNDNIDLYLYLVQRAQWWDIVDGVAMWLIGRALKGAVKLSPYLKEWIGSDNLWVRRTALLTQLQYKKDTDFDLLRELIHEVTHEKEFFIRKAIGWVLRQYSYSNPEAVLQYVSKHETELSKLSVTEALKGLKRKGILA